MKSSAVAQVEARLDQPRRIDDERRLAVGFSGLHDAWNALVHHSAAPRISYAGGTPATTFSCSLTMPSISASGRGGQPGTWMSTGHDLVHALQRRVVVEHPAGGSARAHGDHPLRLEHLVVDLPQRLGHLVDDAAGDDEQVGLSRRRAERLHPEARDVVARRDDRHHLDRAAGEAERVRPHRLRLRPRDGPLERRQHEPLLELFDLLLEDAGALALPQHALGLEAVVAQRLAVHRHSSAPFRQT